MQNFAFGGFSAPQLGQCGVKAVPHDMQNFAFGGFSAPQLGQCPAIAHKVTPRQACGGVISVTRAY